MTPPPPADDYTRLSGDQRRALLDAAIERHGRVCCICGLSIPEGQESLQHVAPRSRGGARSQDNERPAHKRCNFGAGAKVLDGPAGEIHNGIPALLALMERKS